MSLSRGLPSLTRATRATRATGVGLHIFRKSLLPASRSYVDAVIASSSDVEPVKEVSETREGWFFIDSVLPVRLGTWDLRYYIGTIREESLLERLSALLSGVKAHGFKVLSVEPQEKDGGVFVKFQYNGNEEKSTLEEILLQARENASKHGGIPSWAGIPRGDIWLVKGRPWREDLNRFASPIVKISFEGPDVSEENLYDLLRPYGRIVDLNPPTPVPAGTLRSTTVHFRNVRAATTARNAIHGLSVQSPSTSTVTVLRTAYQKPIQAHAVRDYITSHPKIFLPVLFFLIGTLTYTVFDPIRIFMVEGKVNDWFDYRQFRLYQWIRANTLDRLDNVTSPHPSEVSSTPSGPVEGVWKERQDAEGALARYLSDLPTTVAFIHGPQGSGKRRMISAAIETRKRKALVIDVTELSKANSDMILVSGLANQTGYWPVFSFLNSVNNLIDLASVGLIGQKTGLSSSLSDQLKQILEVVGTGLRGVNTSYRKQHERDVKAEHTAELLHADELHVEEKIKKGIWHDPRLDCVSGNGVMSELGIGDELFTDLDIDQPLLNTNSENNREKENGSGEERRKQRSAEDLQAIEAMPVVIIKGYESKGGDARRQDLLDVLSQWTATLVENQVAHVIVISDNRENAKRLAKALPSKPLNLIALSDADSASALSFVKQKLHDVDVDIDFTKEQVVQVQRLGGRASDLEALIHRVRSGQNVEAAVEDIITRGVSELRKNAFGDDIEDAKTLPWSREQAWILMKQLAKKSEIPYHDVLIDFPFKGDETALRSMEYSELISIVTHNGRPSTIRPGKPVYKYVFERLVNDPVFQATQDIAFNMKVIASSETMIKSCEAELITLKDVDAGTSSWWGSRKAVTQRIEYLLKYMRTANAKIEAAEKQNASLKKILAKATNQ
ncbi:exonuclease [Abortiporus biennis]|nr:exonuclease [Abortiporus biennis]